MDDINTANVGFEKEIWERGGQASRQYGRFGIQKYRFGADFSKIHF